MLACHHDVTMLRKNIPQQNNCYQICCPVSLAVLLVTIIQKDIDIEIAGDNLDTLEKTAGRLKNYINHQNIGGIEGLQPDVQNDKPEIVFDVDRERANREGITTNQVNQALGTAVFGAKASDFRNTTEDNYEIDVRAQEDKRNNIDVLRNMKITYRDLATGGLSGRCQYRLLLI